MRQQEWTRRLPLTQVRGLVGPFRMIPTLVIAAVGVLSTGAVAAPFLTGAPPGFTGGYGEAHCGQCHYGSPIGDEAGSLTVSGLPQRYAAGQTYAFTVTLRHPILEHGGFQIAARFLTAVAQDPARAL